jgi:hypothetical protein
VSAQAHGERVKIGREIDVHVGDGVGIARAPSGAQREAASLVLQVHRAQLGELHREQACHSKRAVGTGVVRDCDLEREIEVAFQVRVQCADARGEHALLVVDGMTISTVWGLSGFMSRILQRWFARALEER